MTGLDRVVVVVAGLFGAAGVGLAAAGSHETADNLSIAADFLLFHAAALIGLAALGLIVPARRLVLAAALVLAMATILFAGDLVLRFYTDERLFPFAAPLGGSGLMLGWVLVAVAGLWPASKRPDGTA